MLNKVFPATLPNIVCLFCSSGQAPNVKKNCDSLSLFPVLAVATRPTIKIEKVINRYFFLHYLLYLFLQILGVSELHSKNNTFRCKQ